MAGAEMMNFTDIGKDWTSGARLRNLRRRYRDIAAGVSCVVPGPSLSLGFNELNSVSCASSSFCLAVGRQGAITPASPLAEEWNGSSWSAVTVAAGPGSAGSVLSSVSCAGASFCVLVGSTESFGPGPTTTLIETWNGQALSVTPSPDAAGNASLLNGVTCFSQTACSAVGQSESAGAPQNFALSWNGSSWAIVATPSGPGSAPTATNAVACLTDWECVAVGQYVTDGGLDENQPFVMSAPIARSGYRFVASDGGVFAYGAGAPFLGSMGGQHLNKPIVGMAVMPAGDGYYLVASVGGIFNFGSAQFYGSTGSLHLNKPIVGMAATPDGKGYWLVASDGGIFNYGDAQFLGSAGALVLNKPIVGMAVMPAGDGYYRVASDGGIFTYPTTGGPPFLGSTGSLTLNKPIVGMTTVAGGYYLSGSDGGIFTYPTAGGPPFFGSTGSIVLNKTIVGVAS